MPSTRGSGMTELSGVDRDPAGFGAFQPDGLLRDVLTAGQVGLWSWHPADDVFFADVRSFFTTFYHVSPTDEQLRALIQDLGESRG